VADRTGFLVNPFRINGLIGGGGPGEDHGEKQGSEAGRGPGHGFELVLYLIIIRNYVFTDGRRIARSQYTPRNFPTD
jgi:hypothetical protein